MATRSRFVSLGSMLLTLSLFWGYSLAVESKPAPEGSSRRTEVSLRFSKHEGYSRLVFEASDESFIKDAIVTAPQNQIKIEFPAYPDIKRQGAVGVEGYLRGKTYTIAFTAPFSIKVMKLSSPPRLSIDVAEAPKEEDRKPAGAETRSPALPTGQAGAVPNIRIVLDPGHGGYDLGMLPGETREKDVTLSLARAIETALLKKNKTVHLTRKADQFMSITDRALFANQKSPDAMISIHLSSTDNFVIYTALAEPTGAESAAEIYSLASRQRRFIDKSRLLSESLGKALKDEFKRDMVYRRMDLPLLNAVGAAAVMIELPGTIIYDQAMKTRLSDTILRGIALYANQ